MAIADASQSISLSGFQTRNIAVDTRLSSQASCLANMTIPVTVSSSAGTFNSEINLLTAANRATTNGTFSDGAESADSQNQLKENKKKSTRTPPDQSRETLNQTPEGAESVKVLISGT